jgi:ketosteroid isomerase-like protein
MNCEPIIHRFWDLMRSNDFVATAEVLADDFVLEWPQSKERIRGAANFARMNGEYPAHGRWTFALNALVADENSAVSDVSVSDGVVHARVISFFTIRDGKIAFVREFWPDDMPAAENRAHLIERFE